MIVILEGINGVGKTTYARALSSALHAPTYRAFRDDLKNEHLGQDGERERLLKKYDVGHNTHRDDLYAADLLGRLDVDVIMDRSLPSAIAYDRLEDRPQLPHDCEELLNFWQEMFGVPQKVLYIWLVAPYEMAKERALSRPDQFWPLNHHKYTELHATFASIYWQLKMRKFAIDTSKLTPDEGVEGILGACRQHLSK